MYESSSDEIPIGSPLSSMREQRYWHIEVSCRAGVGGSTLTVWTVSMFADEYRAVTFIGSWSRPSERTTISGAG